MRKTNPVSLTIIGRKYLPIQAPILDLVYTGVGRFRKKYINYPRKIYMDHDIYDDLMQQMDVRYMVSHTGTCNSLMNMDLIISKTKGMRISGPDAFSPQFSYRTT